MTEEDVLISIAEIVMQVNKTFNINFKQPKVDFFEHRAIAGIATYSEYKVSFNRTLMSQDGFNNTVIHEIAHLVMRQLFPEAKQAHGPEFKHVMRMLGGEPSTYHSYHVAPAKRRTVTRHVAKC